MTEYDYSPAAYEKYLATQSRVSNWVSDQASRVPHYSNPLAHGRQPSRSHSQRSQPPRAQAPPSQVQLVSRPSNHRSHTSTSPPPAAPLIDPRHSTRVSPVQASSRPQPSRSRTLPTNAHYTAPSQPAYPGRPPPGLPQAPPGYNTAYKAYTYDPTGRNEIVLPHPRPGETYVIIPPKGRRVEVVHGSASGSHSRSTSRSSARSQTTKKSTPLLKRLLTNLSPTTERSPTYPRPPIRTRSY
ncbi:hypothetical protein AcW1_009627 [Taiwanofungus camphoratus]|nr:hypothetical protein AcV5_002473 [Antrodia cinnamomea]KAI0948010.1 hypothetical protein AcW1_009627 [Antrodia cinnamomea]